MDKDTELFKGKSFADIMSDVYHNSKKKDRQLKLLIAQLEPLVKNLQDATVIVPLIKEYMEVAVRNDEQIVKLAAIVQRMMKDENSGDVGGRGNTDVFVETQNNPPPSFNALEVDPIVDVYNQGYGTGTYYAVYNFIHFELGSSEPYFISEISPDRTEIRIKNNFILNTNIEGLYNEFRNKLDSNPDFDEFYVHRDLVPLKDALKKI